MRYFEGITTLAGGKRRYNSLAKELHPDRGGDPAEFRELVLQWEAFQKLTARMPPPPKPRKAPRKPAESSEPQPSALAPIPPQESPDAARQARKKQKMKTALLRFGVNAFDYLLDNLIFGDDDATD